MSGRMAWALLDPSQMPGLSPAERSRIRSRVRQLEDPELLSDWVRRRSARQRLYSAEPHDVQQDSRLFLSGISDFRSMMSAGHQVEGYVLASEVEQLMDDYLLFEPSSPQEANIFLHVVDQLPREVSPLLIAADLADHGGPRELGQAERLIAEAKNGDMQW